MADITPGIYLEVKEGSIGTGATSRTQQYRNFWMTLIQDGSEVKVRLLDADFQLTAVSEVFSVADFESGRLTYIPQGDKKYQALILKLKQTAKPPASKPRPLEEPSASPDKPASGKWWESPPKDIKPGDIFNRDESSRGSSSKPGTGTKPGAKKNWWDR